MFWGLVLEPHKKYTQTVEQAFHVSIASIDLTHCDQQEEFTAVCVRRDDCDFIICNLSRKHKILNVNLDLNFIAGDTIDFHVNGNSTVHLTGYLTDDFLEEMGSGESGEEESEDESRNVLLKNTKKLLDAVPSKRKAGASAQNANKKSKVDEGDEDSEDSDSDFDMASDSDGVEEEDESGEEEEEEEDDDSDLDDEEEVMKKLQEAKEQQGKKGKQDKQMAKGKQEPQKSAKQLKQEKKSQVPVNGQAQSQSPNQAKALQKRIVEGGVQVEDLRVGNGPVAKPGKTVSVYYVGRLKQNNKQFDQVISGAGFKFRLGRGEVIKGWDVGVAGMKVGSKRRLTVPPKMAYGDRGAPPSIPPKSALVFEVELRNVQ